MERQEIKNLEQVLLQTLWSLFEKKNHPNKLLLIVLNIHKYNVIWQISIYQSGHPRLPTCNDAVHSQTMHIAFNQRDIFTLTDIFVGGPINII